MWKLEQVQQSPPRFLGVWSTCCIGTDWGSEVYFSLEIFNVRLDKALSNLFWSPREPCFEQGDGLQIFWGLSLPTWITPWFSDSKILKFTGCMTQLGLEMGSDLHQRGMNEEKKKKKHLWTWTQHCCDVATHFLEPTCYLLRVLHTSCWVHCSCVLGCLTHCLLFFKAFGADQVIPG